MHYLIVALSREWCYLTQSWTPPPPSPQHYSVVDASEGQIFIAVYHTFNSTNLYLSEEAGLSYALSLEFIVSPPESDWVGGYPTFDVHVVSQFVCLSACMPIMASIDVCCQIILV